MRFSDRADAGRQLAPLVAALRVDRPVVIGLARGGVPVAREVAVRLSAPLDVMVVRKIGAPGYPELAIGAVARGHLHLDSRLIARSGASPAFVQREVTRQTAELDRRERLYRRGRAAVPIEGRSIVLVDDGLATGASARVAIAAVRLRHPTRLVLAVPVCPPVTAELLRPLVDELVAVELPDDFTSVGSWYDDFSQTDDDEVIRCLDQPMASDGTTTQVA